MTQREIKFRAWDKIAGKMIYPNKIVSGAMVDEGDFFIHGTGEIIQIKTMETFWPVKNLELMQFTGLKDKNGKEIFEGDILRNKRNNIFNVVVRWDEEGYWHPLTSGASCGCCGEFTYWSGDEEREVIGNIWENPKLWRESE